MHTPEQLRQMTGAERLALLEKLAEGYYGSTSFSKLLARDLGIAPRTWFDWKRRGGAPEMAVAAFEGWTEAPEAQRRLVDDFSEVVEQLAAVNKATAQIAAALGRIVKRLPAVTGDAASASTLPPDGDE